ncbi:hypothetical protein Pan216_47720 [Planctomycetes bacterium Pan216]|uniref:Uncharacterized protein n=1 Tax=Kolteria novifilia TaxID=2527975 RepID=A0A518BA84_9BACT|nr:hypothetical protein Pan216_47720 [Planctomycetes bacterium Pan216]
MNPLSPLASRALDPLSSLKRFFGNATRRSDRREVTPGRAPAMIEALTERIVPATFVLNSSTLVVTLAADESVTLTATGNNDASDGAQLSLDGTTWTGVDNAPTILGNGEEVLRFANNDRNVTQVVINGEANNAVTLAETSAPFASELSITLEQGDAITNSGAFGLLNDKLTVVASGVDFTQSPNGGLSLGDRALFQLGTSGDLRLDSSNNFSNGHLVWVDGNDVVVVDNDNVQFASSFINGDLEVRSARGIADDGGVHVLGTTTLEAGSGQKIDFDHQRTRFVGPVHATTDGGDVYLEIRSDDLTLGAVNTDGGSVYLLGNNISQTAAIDTSNNNGTAFGDVEASSSIGGDIVLDHPDNHFDAAGGAHVVIANLGSGAFNSLSVFTKGDLDFIDVSGIRIQHELSLGAQGSVTTTNGQPLTAYGLTTVTAGGAVDMYHASKLNELAVFQSSADAMVKVGHYDNLTFWGEVAGTLHVEVGRNLILGGGGDLTLTGDQDAFFATNETIEILDTTVNLGGGRSEFLINDGAPVVVTSTNGTGTLFVGRDGEVTVSSGGSVRIGAGSVLAGEGYVNVSNGGVTVEPTAKVGASGEASPDNLGISGDLTFGAGAIFVQEIAGTRSREFGTMSVDGTVDITNADLTFDLEGYTAQIGDRFTILVATNLTGGFRNLDENNQITVDEVTFQITTTTSMVRLEVVAVAPPNPFEGIGVYRSSTAEFVFNTSDVFDFDPNQYFSVVFGNPRDKGFVGDFTGDGSPNVAVYRDLTLFLPIPIPFDAFFIINTSPIDDFDPDSFVVTPFIGVGFEQPFAGDWDGDGDDDLGLYRNATATYVAANLPPIAPRQTGLVGFDTIRNLVFGNPSTEQNPTDAPAVGRFNASYAADQIGFGSQGRLYMADIDIATLPAGNTSIDAYAIPSPEFFGATGDQQLNGQFAVDSTGLDQRGIFRAAAATFSISSGSQPNIIFGQAGDRAIAGNWIGLDLPTTESQIDLFFENDS